MIGPPYLVRLANRRFPILLFAGLLGACTPAAGRMQLVPAASPAQVELDNGAVLVPVVLNGRGPFKMIVDNAVTGVNVVDRSVAASLGLASVGKAGRGRSDGGDVELGSAVLPTLEVANLRMDDVPVAVADLPEGVRRTSAGEQVAGFLGSPLFARYAVSLDLVEGKLSFLEPSDAGRAGPGQELIGTARNDALVKAVVNGHPVRLSLDLGYGLAPVALDHGVAVDLLGTQVLGALPEYRAATAGGNVGGRRLTLESLRVGPFHRTSVAATSLPEGAAGSWSSDGYIGLPFFAGCRTVFNLPKDIILLDCQAQPAG